MMKLLNRIDYKGHGFLYFGLVAAILFIVSYGMFRFNGDRPNFVLKEINGQVHKVDKTTVTGSSKGRTTFTKCTRVELINNSQRFFSKNLSNTKLFYQGQYVRLLAYKYRGDYYFVSVEEDGKVLLAHNNTKGIIVFSVMIVCGILTIFSIYKRREAFKQK